MWNDINLRDKAFGFVVLVLLLLASACGSDNGNSETGNVSGLRIPEGFPMPNFPEDNPYTVEKATLGRFLFYDKKLSLNNQQSCSSCHEQDKAFTDGKVLAIGSTGQVHPRHSAALANVAYNVTLNWANPLVQKLEDQLLIPLFSGEPIELGFSGKEDVLIDRLASDPSYQEMFAGAFPGEEISISTIGKAIATFERSLMSGNSPYDQYVYQGNQDAISTSAKRGLELFFSERLECDHCHGGVNFSSATTHANETFLTQPQFENNGLYNIDGKGAYPSNNRGLIDFTSKSTDMGKFKPPSLRNIGLTAPYMHDGSIADLRGVIAHYSRGGRNVTSGSYQGDGSTSPYKSGLISGFSLSAQETDDLLEFLHTLTDSEFVSRCDISDPFNPPAHCSGTN